MINNIYVKQIDNKYHDIRVSYLQCRLAVKLRTFWALRFWLELIIEVQAGPGHKGDTFHQPIWQPKGTMQALQN